MGSYRQLTSEELASILRDCAAVLLPEVQTMKACGLIWKIIFYTLHKSKNEEIRMALLQLQKLDFVLDDYEVTDLAGLKPHDIALLCGLIPLEITEEQAANTQIKADRQATTLRQQHNRANRQN
jgi:hypothetical protein